MFGLKDMFKNMGAMAKLAKDDNFKHLMSHPKIQALLSKKEFQDAAKSKNYMKLMTNPEFAKVFQDPEVLAMVSKIDKGSLGSFGK